MVAEFASRGWPLKSICGMPPLFVREQLVAPYLRASIRGRSNGIWIVDGWLGIIHQSFEYSWARMGQEQVGESMPNNVSNTLHLGNFPELDRYLLPGRLETDLKVVCERISALVDSLPRTEESLRAAYESGYVLGRPVDDFRCGLSVGKFRAFKRFVLAGVNVQGD